MGKIRAKAVQMGGVSATESTMEIIFEGRVSQSQAMAIGRLVRWVTESDRLKEIEAMQHRRKAHG